MIQDIEPYIYDNQYHPVPPDKDSYLLCYSGRTVCMKTEDGIGRFPTFREAECCNDKKEMYENYRYLFSIDDMRFYLGSHLNWRDIPGFVQEDKEVFRTARPGYLCFAGVTGWQLHRWYETRKYCGRCGEPMVHDEKERMMKCPHCNQVEFPKICPAVIVAVTDGNRIVMSKYAGREFKKYALLAGFAEVGETIEDTVRREVMEEVGLQVKNITFYKSQPWSYSDTLLMGFFCEVDGDTTMKIDEEELALAEWFEREEMPVQRSGTSLTNEMMFAFKDKTFFSN